MKMFPRTAKIKGSCQSFSEHRMQSWAPQSNWIMWKMLNSWNSSDFILLGPGKTPSSTRTEDNREWENIRARLPAQAWKPCQSQLQEIKLVFSYLLSLWWSIKLKKNVTHFDLIEIQDSVKCRVQHTELYSVWEREKVFQNVNKRIKKRFLLKTARQDSLGKV